MENNLCSHLINKILTLNYKLVKCVNTSIVFMNLSKLKTSRVNCKRAWYCKDLNHTVNQIQK